jgi:DNA-binding transcriptional ArsR family regulator
VDSVQQLIWWLFQSSVGGPTRVRMVRALRAEPRNAQQLALALELDYTTVRHHLRVLERNHLLEVRGDRYGQVYFIAPNLESHWPALEEILAKASARRSGE